MTSRSGWGKGNRTCHGSTLREIAKQSSARHGLRSVLLDRIEYYCYRDHFACPMVEVKTTKLRNFLNGKTSERVRVGVIDQTATVLEAVSHPRGFIAPTRVEEILR